MNNKPRDPYINCILQNNCSTRCQKKLKYVEYHIKNLSFKYDERYDDIQSKLREL